MGTVKKGPRVLRNPTSLANATKRKAGSTHHQPPLFPSMYLYARFFAGPERFPERRPCPNHEIKEDVSTEGYILPQLLLSHRCWNQTACDRVSRHFFIQRFSGGGIFNDK